MQPGFRGHSAVDRNEGSEMMGEFKRRKVHGCGARYVVELRDNRVDVWREVEWIGQWAWTGEAFGKRLQGRRLLSATRMHAADEVQAMLAASLRGGS